MVAGADSITVNGDQLTGAGFEINGDSAVNGGGNDTISFIGSVLSSSTIKGKGGADVITIGSGVAGTGSSVLGNAGADVINFSGDFSNGSANLIGGGSGNDPIFFSGTDLGDTNSIKGGGGADSIFIVSGEAGNLSGAIYGGAGADSITILSGNMTGGIGFAYESLTESTLEKMDVITVSGGVTGGMLFSLSAVTTNLTTGLVGGVGFNGVVDDGFIASGDFTDQGTTAASVTARATLLDGQSQTLGETFLFEDGSNNVYLFVQGGASGVADDLVVDIADGGLTAAPTMDLTSGGIKLD